MDETSTTNFYDLPKHELLRACGQMTVQAGLFLIAVSSVMKHLGNLPEVPITPTANGPSVAASMESGQTKQHGYFD